MSTDDQFQRETQVPCGEKILRLSKESKLFQKFFHHLNLDQISNDYFLEWHETPDREAKMEVWDRYRKDVTVSVLATIGIETAFALSLHLVFTDVRFSVLLVGFIWAIITAFTR
jgi:hypothetical protein